VRNEEEEELNGEVLVAMLVILALVEVIKRNKKRGSVQHSTST